VLAAQSRWVNAELTATPARKQICDFSATAPEHLILSRCTHDTRRFLAIGFFEIHRRGRLAIKRL